MCNGDASSGLKTHIRIHTNTCYSPHDQPTEGGVGGEECPNNFDHSKVLVSMSINTW